MSERPPIPPARSPELEHADAILARIKRDLPPSPSHQGVRNRGGRVILQLHAEAWCMPSVQHLSLPARGVLIELLLQFAAGYSSIPARGLSALVGLAQGACDELLAELILADLVLVSAGHAYLLPAAAGALLLGDVAEA